MLRSVKFGLFALAMFACPAVSLASVIQYQITVEVTADPNSPGSFGAVNPWSFSSIPATFVGTFDADDTVIGPISNLALIIGGLDIAASHPNVLLNVFDPITLTLNSAQVDPTGNLSAVAFGSTFVGAPANYAVGLENLLVGPLDPYYPNSTQNWVGTFDIAPTAAVPEPAILTMFGLGAVGLVAGAIRRRRQTKAAV